MNMPFLRETAEGVYLAIKVQPRASRQAIAGVQGSELKISVTAPPVESAANQALIEFLSDLLKISRAQIAVVKGQTSRHKTVFVRGALAKELNAELASHLE